MNATTTSNASRVAFVGSIDERRESIGVWRNERSELFQYDEGPDEEDDE